jgi:3-methyladenine DNA glycosylase/8-oxoguanine DNA glycosylase
MHPHNERYHRDCERTVRLVGDDTGYTGYDDFIKSSEMPDLRTIYNKKFEMLAEQEELEYIEERLRREDEIKEILLLSGMSQAERINKISSIEKSARALQDKFKGMIYELTQMDSEVANLIDACRTYEKCVMYKPGVEK